MSLGGKFRETGRKQKIDRDERKGLILYTRLTHRTGRGEIEVEETGGDDEGEPE